MSTLKNKYGRFCVFQITEAILPWDRGFRIFLWLFMYINRRIKIIVFIRHEWTFCISTSVYLIYVNAPEQPTTAYCRWLVVFRKTINHKSQYQLEWVPRHVIILASSRPTALRYNVHLIWLWQCLSGHSRGDSGLIRKLNDSKKKLIRVKISASFTQWFKSSSTRMVLSSHNSLCIDCMKRYVFLAWERMNDL